MSASAYATQTHQLEASATLAYTHPASQSVLAATPLRNNNSKRTKTCTPGGPPSPPKVTNVASRIHNSYSVFAELESSHDSPMPDDDGTVTVTFEAESMPQPPDPRGPASIPALSVSTPEVPKTSSVPAIDLSEIEPPDSTADEPHTTMALPAKTVYSSLQAASIRGTALSLPVILASTDNDASFHDGANALDVVPLQIDTTESTGASMFPEPDKHTPPNEVDSSDMFEGDDIYSVPSQVRPPEEEFPQDILNDTNMADADNCTTNTNMDTNPESLLDEKHQHSVPGNLQSGLRHVAETTVIDGLGPEMDTAGFQSSRDEINEAELAEYFSEEESTSSNDDCESFEHPTAGTIDLDYDGLHAATEGVHALHVSYDPTTGSNGGGLS